MRLNAPTTIIEGRRHLDVDGRRFGELDTTRMLEAQPFVRRTPHLDHRTSD